MSLRLSVPSFLVFTLLLLAATTRAQQNAKEIEPELVPQMGPDGECRRLAFSRDGRYVITSGMDPGTTIQAWDTATGSLLRNLRSQSGDFSLFRVGKVISERGESFDLSPVSWGEGELGFSPDGKYVALFPQASITQKRKPGEKLKPVAGPMPYIWDLASGKAMIQSEWIVDPTGKTLVNKDIPWTIEQLASWGSATGEAAIQWGQKHTRSANGNQGLFDARMALSPDGKYFARVDGYGDLWDVRGERQIPGFCDSRVLQWKSLALSADGKLLAAASTGKEFIVWSLEKSQAPLAADAFAGLKSIAISPDAKHIATGTRWDSRDRQGDLVYDGQMALWNSASLQREHPVNGDPPPVEEYSSPAMAVAFSRDAKLVSGMIEMDPNPWTNDYVIYQGVLKMWDPVENKLLWKRTLPDSELSAVAFSPDGKLVATGHQGVRVKLYDVAKSNRVRFFNDKEAFVGDPAGRYPVVLSLAFSPDGRMLASGGSSGQLYVWEAQTGKQLAHLSEPHSEGEMEVMYEIRGDSLAATRESVEAVVFSANGKRLYSTGCEGTINVWDTATWTLLSTLAPTQDRCIRSLSLSPDGKWLVSAGEDGQILFWEGDSGKLGARLLIGQEGKDWLVVAANGLFDGTEEGIRTLAAWRTQNRLVSFVSLPAEFRVNGLLQKILSGHAPASQVNLSLFLQKP